ncbi:MAG TPA: AraC family transcriptional regulator [Pseudogracilibacillus sp.]|nr:AraC family transcriptional regulator [Pseudogracilibacillus sp.]
MDDKLFQELSKISKEEKVILEEGLVPKQIYTDQTSFVVEGEKFLKQDTLIMVRKHTRFVNFPKHRHNFIEMIYVYNGEMRQKVGDTPIVLKQGELLFLNQYIEHSIEASKENDIIINFIIKPEFFEFVFSFISPDNKISSFLFNSVFQYTDYEQFLYFMVSEVSSIQELVHKMITEMMYPSVLSESVIKLNMGLLLIELIKNIDKVRHIKKEAAHQYILIKSLKYIEENFKTATLSELAEELNQSDYTLSKYIKEATQLTFKELLQEKRLSKAKELLSGTKIPITRIIEEVGYNNVSYFYRIFKNKYGQTPKQFREQ